MPRRGRFKVGDRVVRRVFIRREPSENKGHITSLEGLDAMYVLFDGGSQQLVLRRDMRRVRSGE